jgi:hypothetical protein
MQLLTKIINANSFLYSNQKVRSSLGLRSFPLSVYHLLVNVIHNSRLYTEVSPNETARLDPQARPVPTNLDPGLVRQQD